MTTTLVIELLTLVLLFICSAFFSSSETALFSLNPIQIHRIRKSNPKSADRITRLRAAPTHLLSTVLIGNTLVNVAAATLGFVIARQQFPDHSKAVAIPAMIILTLIFGEVVPKQIAVRNPERLASVYSPILEVLTRILVPLQFLLNLATRPFERSLSPTSPTLTEDEFLTAVEVGQEEGLLDNEERTMVDGIIRLEEIQASDVMTPRVDLVGIDLEDDLAEHEQIARRVTFKHLPVYRGTLDEAEGFLDVPRFLLSPYRDLKGSMHKPTFVPETAPLDAVLAQFQKEKRKIAFVADEYGGTAGIITMGDILDEIVSAVDNEYGEQKLDIQKIGHNQWQVDGSASLEDINYELDLELDAEGADRIAGWATAYAEHILKPGEVVEAQGCRVTVRRAKKQRITDMVIEKLPGTA